MNEEKTALGQKILRLKREKRLRWGEVAEAIGHSAVFACAACLGQMSPTAEAAEKARYVIGLYAASLASGDTQRHTLVAAVLADFERLAAEDQAVSP